MPIFFRLPGAIFILLLVFFFFVFFGFLREFPRMTLGPAGVLSFSSLFCASDPPDTDDIVLHREPPTGYCRHSYPRAAVSGGRLPPFFS